VVAVVLRSRRQDLASVGLRREGLRRSIMLGLAAAGVLSAVNVGLAYWEGARHLNILEAAQMTALFAFLAAQEELIFRGYLTTRLHGLISRPRVAQLLGVLLFVSVHLPGKLLPSPAEYLAAFDVSDALWLANLLLVGYVYDTLYRVTGSIAGCATAHFLVNISYSLLV
jgi:membrane protease YdiL (CAAX protease family)